jgi:hypothetical protein
MNELIDDLIDMFPDDDDLYVYKTAIFAGSMMDKSRVCRGFVHQIESVYGDKILQNDDTLFLHSDTNVCIPNNGSHTNILPKIKTIWEQLQENDKIVVWKYLKVLVILSRKSGISSC